MQRTKYACRKVLEYALIGYVSGILIGCAARLLLT